MNIVDLFCGAGGLSAGFRKAGFDIATAIDINEDAIQTYKYNQECEPICGDISKEGQIQKIQESIRENGYEPSGVDVVIGSPPCRGFSKANVRTRNKNNILNGLTHYFVEVVNELNPKAIVIENVPGILRMSDGSFKKSIEAVFEKIGYNIESTILKAEQYGVPQRRRRAFFIGVKRGHPPMPSPIYPSWGENNKKSEHITVRDAISDLPSLPEGGGGKQVMEYEGDVTKSDYVEGLRVNIDDGVIYNHETTVNREKTRERFQYIPQGGNWENIPPELMSDYTNRNKTHDHIYQRLKPNEPAKTVANFRKQMIVHPNQNRLLSTREAARLQSFPDNYRFISDKKVARQQMVGDAVPVKLAEAIAEELHSHIDGEIEGDHSKRSSI